MDRIKRLRERRASVKAAGIEVRKEISQLVDADSFVELSTFSFSKNTFYNEDAEGEGVVTGFATVSGYPFYIVAQNFEVFSGGLSKANCEKIAKALNAAEKNNTPVVYLLHSRGVRVGEGVNVLEGIAELLLKATQLKGSVPQYAFLSGEVYGSAAALASICDCVFFTDKSVLSVNSPLVLAAKENKNLKNTEVGGYDALRHAGLPAVRVNDVKEAAALIAKMTELLAVPVKDAELNEPVPALNNKADAETIVKLLDESVELGANSCPEVRTVLGRIGGVSVAAVVFDNVKLNLENVRKIKNFAEFACCYSLPFITFVDCTGVEASLSVNNSAVLKEIGEYLSMIDAIDTAKIGVVTGKAAGLGYSLFAAKSAGFDYTFALATAEVSLFESSVGAQIEYSDEHADKAKLQELYSEEHAEPLNEANGGYLDVVVEPQFL